MHDYDSEFPFCLEREAWVTVIPAFGQRSSFKVLNHLKFLLDMIVHTFSPICILMWELGALLIWTLEYLFTFKISWVWVHVCAWQEMSGVAVAWWRYNTRLVSMDVVLWFQILLAIKISFQGISWWGVETNNKYTNNLALLFIGNGRFLIYD